MKATIFSLLGLLAATLAQPPPTNLTFTPNLTSTSDDDRPPTKNYVAVKSKSQRPNYKTCPYRLCTRPWMEPPPRDFKMTCWTRGDYVGDSSEWSNIWLYSKYYGVYLPKVAFPKYNGRYDEDLEYCGRIELAINKISPVKIEHYSSCYGEPSAKSVIKRHYKEDQPIHLACVTTGDEIEGYSEWYQTTDDCFILENAIYRQDRTNSDVFDSCDYFRYNFGGIPVVGDAVNITLINISNRRNRIRVNKS